MDLLLGAAIRLNEKGETMNRLIYPLAALAALSMTTPAFAQSGEPRERNVRITVIDHERGRTVVSSRGEYVRIDTRGEGPNGQHGRNSASGDHDKTVRDIVRSTGGNVRYESPRPRGRLGREVD